MDTVAPSRFRNLPLYLLAFMLLFTAIYALFWYAQMRNFKATVALMQNGQGALFDVEARSTSFSGFPYRLQVNFEAARLVRQRPDYLVSVVAPRARLTRLLWSPDHWVLMADRPKVAVRSRGGSAPLQLGLEAEGLQSSLRFSPQKIERLSFEFKQARWTDGQQFADVVTMNDLQFHLRDSKISSAQGKEPQAANVFANLRVVAGGVQSGRSTPINMDFYADLTGGVRLSDTVPALAAWQARKGTMVINRFKFARSGLLWTAHGSLGLTGAGKLTGRGMLITNAQAQTLQALGANGNADTQASQTPINAPWTISDGTLALDGRTAALLPIDLLDAITDSQRP